MNMLFHISLPLLLIFSSCSLFDNEPKPLEPIPTFFYAQINGERFDANRASASMSSSNNKSFLNFSGSYSDDNLFPFTKKILFLMVYNDTSNNYSLHFDSALSNDIGFNVPVGSYYENDGDVIISDYQAPDDSDGFVSVELEELEDGRKTISGTFEMTVYLKKRINTAFPQQEQDTLHITNGKYLLELRDFRKEE